MPKVGNKKFPYTAKGKAMAKKESKKTGKKMTSAYMKYEKSEPMAEKKMEAKKGMKMMKKASKKK